MSGVVRDALSPSHGTSAHSRVPARSSDKTNPARVRAYLAALPPASRKVTRELGAIVRAAAPGAVDAFSYNMPAIAVDGKKVVWYAGWKSHSGLYPISGSTRKALESQLQGRPRHTRRRTPDRRRRRWRVVRQ